MNTIFRVAMLLALAAARSVAADAAFSRDGKRVYLLEFDTPKLTVIDIENQSASKLDLGAFTGHQPILAVSVSSSGNLLFITKRDAWAYSFEKKSCVKLCSVAEGTEFDDLAYGLKSGAILFSIRTGEEHGALFLTRDATKPLPVFMRRVSYLEGITFSERGELFFGTHGDLWQGSIEADRDDPQKPRGVLVAARCAPLATLETYVGTPMQIGVRCVAVAGEKIYVHVHRMGGSGWGNIVRLRKPEVDAEDSLRARLKLYAKELSSVEILEDNGSASYLCASPDGKRVFFTTGRADSEHTEFFLVENNEEPLAMKVNGTK
jgi:hypothetical protein